MPSSKRGRNRAKQTSQPTADSSSTSSGFRAPRTPPPKAHHLPTTSNARGRSQTRTGTGPMPGLSGIPLTFDTGVDPDENCSLSSSMHHAPPPHPESDIQVRLRGISESVGISGSDFQSQINSTPFHAAAARPSEKGKSAKIQGLLLMNTVGRPPKANENYIIKQGFASSWKNDEIEAWLLSEENQVFGAECVKSWSEKGRSLNPAGWCLPEATTQEKALYAPFFSILEAIIKNFVGPTLGPGLERKVIRSDKLSLTHKDGEKHTSPDFVICATGPSFETPADGKAVGYSNIIAYFDAKIHKKVGSGANLKQMAVYSQQIFAQQPNRLFVRCIIFSEKVAQLVQFDRAGSQTTHYINIHDEPALFVRMIIELCEADERKIGFDDTIQWTIVNGKKESGTITYGDPGKEKIYHLTDPHPIAHSSDIRGTATTLWGVYEDGADDKVFLIKDSWGSAGRTPEHKLLLETAGVKGVCKMVDYYFRNFTAASFRCPTTIGAFVDRQPVRILIEACGQSLEEFKAASELLCALLDAIVAHYQLYSMHILHRDITNRNILLGGEDAEEGWRGALVDLGAALNFHPEAGDSTISKEARLGTRFFQSCMILNFLCGFTNGQVPPHDHTDDLESFFFVCCYLFFLFNPNGTPRKKGDRAREVVKGWDSVSPREALASKAMIFNPMYGQRQAAVDIVFEDWGVACGTLFECFLDHIWGIQQKKATIIQERRKTETEMKMQAETEGGDEMEGQEGSEQSEPREELEQEVEALQPMGEDPFADDADDGDDDAQFSEDVEQIFEPISLEPKEKVAMKQGLFAPLMDQVSIKYHFETIIDFFTVATTRLRMTPKKHGPPARPEPTPKQQAPKRKVGEGPNEMAGDPNAQKAKNTRTEPA